MHWLFFTVPEYTCRGHTEITQRVCALSINIIFSQEKLIPLYFKITYRYLCKHKKKKKRQKTIATAARTTK